MYLAEPIHLLGFGFVNSIKIILGLSMISSLVFTYLWLRKKFSKLASLVGALVYLYLPYHLYDLYKRGSVGELLALAVVPFIFWQLERNSLFWTSLGVAALILSHNSLALLFLPLIFVYAIIRRKDKTHLYKYSSMLAFGLGISAFFWLPAINDIKFTVFRNIKVSDYTQYFADISIIGIVSIFILLLSVFFASKSSKISKLFFLFAGFDILSLFLASPYSKFIWPYLPSSFIQFPFRLLSVALICTAFLSAFSIEETKKKTKVIVSVAIVLILFVSSYSFLTPLEFFNKGNSYYSTNEDTTTVKNEYMPKWVKQAPLVNSQKLIETNGQIKGLIPKSSSISLVHSAEIEEKVTINKVYFPGWEVKIDGNKTYINYQKNGFLEFSVPKGEHKIEAKFKETQFRIFADLISLVSILSLVIFTIRRKFI